MGIRWQSGTSPTILELSMRDLGKGKVWRANIGRVIIEGAYFQFNEASNDVGFHKIVALLICTRGQFHDCALRQSNNFLLNKFIFIKKKSETLCASFCGYVSHYFVCYLPCLLEHWHVGTLLLGWLELSYVLVSEWSWSWVRKS